MFLSSRCFFACNETQQVWNILSLRQNTLVATIPALVCITALAASSDDATLVSGHDDGVIKLWNVADLDAYPRISQPKITLTAMIQAHSEPVRCLLVDGIRFFSGGYDNKILVSFV